MGVPGQRDNRSSLALRAVSSTVGASSTSMIVGINAGGAPVPSARATLHSVAPGAKAIGRMSSNTKLGLFSATIPRRLIKIQVTGAYSNEQG